MVCYSHLFYNLPEFIVIHTVKGFSIVNKAKVDVFLELSCFFEKKKSGIFHSSLMAEETVIFPVILILFVSNVA